MSIMDGRFVFHRLFLLSFVVRLLVILAEGGIGAHTSYGAFFQVGYSVLCWLNGLFRPVRPTPPSQKLKQMWGKFQKNHSAEIWACDFLQTYALWFRTLFVFFIIELGSRRVIDVLRTPLRASKAHAMSKRFVGGIRREYPDLVLYLNERRLRGKLKNYVHNFNRAHPHQGLAGQRLMQLNSPSTGNKITAFPVLNGLQRDYCRSA